MRVSLPQGARPGLDLFYEKDGPLHMTYRLVRASGDPVTLWMLEHQILQAYRKGLPEVNRNRWWITTLPTVEQSRLIGEWVGGLRIYGHDGWVYDRGGKISQYGVSITMPAPSITIYGATCARCEAYNEYAAQPPAGEDFICTGCRLETDWAKGAH